MKSNCKYVLEMVSKFEKKYAKRGPNPYKKEEESTSFQNNDCSVSSESLGISSGSKARSKSNSDAKRNLPKEKNNELIICRSVLNPVENVIASSLSDRSLESAADISYARKLTEVQIGSSIQKSDMKELTHKSISSINSNVTSRSGKCDDNVALIKTEKNNAFSEKHQKTTFTNEIDNKFHKIDENNIAQTDIKTCDKIEGPALEMSESVYESEEHCKEISVRKNNNINFDTCDEISDVENNTVDSLPVENESSISNVSLHILTFQDLNGVETLKSSLKKFDNLSIKSNSDDKSYVTQDYSKATSYSPEENFSCNPENTDVEKYAVSKILSEMEHSEELQTEIESENESSIKEEIEDEMKVISSGGLSDQIPTISEKCKDLSEVGENTEVNITIAVNKKVNGHDFKSRSNTDFQGKSVKVNKNRRINNKQDNSLLPVSKLEEIHKEIHRKDNNHTDNAILYPKIENSYNAKLRVPKDRPNKIHRQTEKCDNVHVANDLKRDYVKKRSAVKSLHNSEKIFEKKVHHASAQTENYLLLENDDFERKMESIMKSSFVSIPNADAAQEEFQRNFKDQAFQTDITPASSLTPLEKGFYCSLKQQVELTKHFIQAEYNMYLACVTAIKELSATYKPATLHNTRIGQKKKSRKKRTERKETI